MATPSALNPTNIWTCCVYPIEFAFLSFELAHLRTSLYGSPKTTISIIVTVIFLSIDYYLRFITATCGWRIRLQRFHLFYMRVSGYFGDRISWRIGSYSTAEKEAYRWYSGGWEIHWPAMRKSRSRILNEGDILISKARATYFICGARLFPHAVQKLTRF